MKVSVIVPMAPKEQLNFELLLQLKNLPTNWEVLFCSAKEKKIPLEKGFRFIKTPFGRGESMNEGARYANGEWLWFLHMDSLFETDTVEMLQTVMEKKEDALYYFDLKFGTDRIPILWINEMGCRFRSRVLKAPFGDQGFFVKKESFEKVNGYPTWDFYGEDHLFVRSLRRNQIRLIPLNKALLTSARAYRKNGAVKTTIRYQYLWMSQVFRERRRLYEDRNRSFL